MLFRSDIYDSPISPFSNIFTEINSPITNVQGFVIAPSSNLSITAIVRMDDTKLSVVGQSATSLSGPWTNLVQNPTGTASSNQTGVSNGCERRTFSVSKGSNSRMFLRLVVTLSN